MRIIQKQPNVNGGYPPIQSWSGETPPDTHYGVAEGVELSCGGYGTLTIENGVVTAFTGDEAAWSAWQAANPPPTPEPTIEQRTTALESTQSDVIDILASALGVTI